jgi:ComF family protein
MIQQITNLFFPNVCNGCNGFLLQNETVICTECRHEMPQTNHFLEPENEVFNKFYGRISLEMAMSLLYFKKNSRVQQLIHRLKYEGHQEIGTSLANWFADDLKSIEKLKNIEAIIPVPLHKKRLKERGYNQITTFGQALSHSLEIPFLDNILVRNVYAKTQSKKNLLDRNNVNTNIFEVTFSSENHNKHYLLIDDVITTGATLELCANALLKIPGTKISILTIATSQG